MSDENDLDLYDDLEDFDLDEKLRDVCRVFIYYLFIYVNFTSRFFKANQQIADLTERLNQSIEAITRVEAANRHLVQDKNTLSKNTSSLLLTAKNEIRRKDREIQSLRKEYANTIGSMFYID